MRAAWGGLILLIILAGFVLSRAGASYSAQDRRMIGAGRSAAHWAGTDELGRDRMTRTAAALLIGLAGAAVASAITTGLAAAVGTLAAFAPPFLGTGLMMLSDLFLALPWLFLLMMVRSALPLTMAPLASATITFLVLALLGWPACARAVHAGARGLRQADWMTQGRAAGLRPIQLVRHYLMPHLWPLLLPQFLICVPAYLIAEANLGTLGLGISEPLPSWGAMLLELDNSAVLAGSRWVYLPIAVLVSVLVLLELLVIEPVHP